MNKPGKQAKSSQSSRKPIIVVIGGQYGSEGKGMVSAALCRERSVDIAVRTGTVNAGHTVYVGDTAYKMQQLPTSWATTDHNTTMVLGPGAYINPKILTREIEMIDAVSRPSGVCGCGDSIDHHLSPMDADHSPVEQCYPPIPILIDSNAGLHLDGHTDRSTQSGRHHSMGATGKGCSEAVIDKIRLRGSGKTTLFRHWWNEHRVELGPMVSRVSFGNISEYLYDAYRAGKQILIEGTQGCHLDLHLGPYPYTTHKQTQAAQWVQEAGLPIGSGPAGVEYEIVMVVRTYPIRVAGNSGPMPGETSWWHVAKEINNRLYDLGLPQRYPTVIDLNYWEHAVVEASKKYKLSGREALEMHKWDAAMRIKNRVALSELHRDAFNLIPGSVQVNLKNLFEFTTVTNKLRRVAGWDAEVVRQAIRWNAPNTVILSFVNYLLPELWGATIKPDENKDLNLILSKLADDLGQPVDYITTGPKTEHFLSAWKTQYSLGL